MQAHVKHPLETCRLCEGIKERLDRKIVLMNHVQGSDAHADIENRVLDAGGEGEGGTTERE